MKKAILISLALIWIISLSILVIALTDLIPNNIFKEYKFIIVIGFITINWSQIKFKSFYFKVKPKHISNN